MAPEIVKFLPDGSAAGGLKVWPSLPHDRLATPAPARYGRLVIEDQHHGLVAGISRTSPYATKPALREAHLFCFLVEGQVTITAEDGAVSTFGAGEAFVLPAGTVSSWRQDGGVRKYFVSLQALPTDAGTPAPAVVGIDPAAALEPSAPPAEDVLLSPRPATHIVNSFTAAGGRWSAGIWSATPYHRKIIPFPRYEFMHLLEGEVSFTTENGASVRFVEGDTFMVPQGAICDWKNERDVKKIFCVYRPS